MGDEMDGSVVPVEVAHENGASRELSSRSVQVTLTDEVSDMGSAAEESTTVIEAALEKAAAEIQKLDQIMVDINTRREQLAARLGDVLGSMGITPMKGKRGRKAAAGVAKPRKKRGEGVSPDSVLACFGSEPKTAAEVAEELGVTTADLRYPLTALKNKKQIKLAPGSKRGPATAYVLGKK